MKYPKRSPCSAKTPSGHINGVSGHTHEGSGVLRPGSSGVILGFARDPGSAATPTGSSSPVAPVPFPVPLEDRRWLDVNAGSAPVRSATDSSAGRARSRALDQLVEATAWAAPAAEQKVDDGAWAQTLFSNEKAKAKEPLTPEQEEEAFRRLTEFYEETASPFHAASRLWVDAIIDPRETRETLDHLLRIVSMAPMADDSNLGVFQV